MNMLTDNVTAYVHITLNNDLWDMIFFTLFVNLIGQRGLCAIVINKAKFQ